jgi:hypothetical protein
MSHEEEMRSLARGAAIALLAVIGALILHLRSDNRPGDRRALAAKTAKASAPRVAEAPQP